MEALKCIDEAQDLLACDSQPLGATRRSEPNQPGERGKTRSVTSASLSFSNKSKCVILYSSKKLSSYIAMPLLLFVLIELSFSREECCLTRCNDPKNERIWSRGPCLPRTQLGTWESTAGWLGCGKHRTAQATSRVVDDACGWVDMGMGRDPPEPDQSTM